jgi:hypothetical protein
MFTKRLKNNTQLELTICGQTILSGEYYAITISEERNWCGDEYLLQCVSNGSIIVNNGGEDIIDPVEGMKYLINSPKDFSLSPDSKIMVQQTPRVFGTTTCWAGKADDQSSSDKINDGSELFHQHKIGEDLIASKYFDLNTIENRTYIHSGYVQWKNTNWDIFDISLVPKISTIDVNGTGYRHYNNYMLMPEIFGAEYGPIVGITGVPVLVEVFRDAAWHSSRQGFWDADYNSATNSWSNIVPNLTGAGKYNIFTHEIDLSKFVSNIRMLGTTNGFSYLYCYDSEGIGHNMRIKATFKTSNNDHDWDAVIFLTLYRERSC